MIRRGVPSRPRIAEGLEIVEAGQEIEAMPGIHDGQERNHCGYCMYKQSTTFSRRCKPLPGQRCFQSQHSGHLPLARFPTLLTAVRDQKIVRRSPAVRLQPHGRGPRAGADALKLLGRRLRCIREVVASWSSSAGMPQSPIDSVQSGAAAVTQGAEARFKSNWPGERAIQPDRACAPLVRPASLPVVAVPAFRGTHRGIHTHPVSTQHPCPLARGEAGCQQPVIDFARDRKTIERRWRQEQSRIVREAV